MCIRYSSRSTPSFVIFSFMIPKAARAASALIKSCCRNTVPASKPFPTSSRAGIISRFMTVRASAERRDVYKRQVLDGMYGRLIEMIIEWQDEFYSYNLAQDVTRGMKTKAQNGGYQCRPPLGYRIPYHNATPEIVPGEAEIVRMIFDRYVNHKMSIFALTRYLNSLGLKTSQGKPFDKRSLEYILQNPAYAGIVRWSRTCNETNEIRDRSEWSVTKGTHPAIISEELYNQAMLRFESEYRPKNAKPAEVTKHWLSGMLKCSACGRTLSSCVRHTKSGDHSSFQCYGCLLYTSRGNGKIVSLVPVPFRVNPVEGK